MKNFRRNKMIGVILNITVILIVIILGIIIWYYTSLLPVSKNEKEMEITIPLGSGVDKIAEILKSNNLIKNKIVFKIYVKLNKIENFKAGTYSLNQSLDVKKMSEILTTGYIQDSNQLTITYLEGKNFKQLANKIAETTNNTVENVMEVIKDEKYIDYLIDKYWFLTEDIKNGDIYYSLEGYLFPDTYRLENKDTRVYNIFERMLNRMGEILNLYKSEIENSKYSIHEVLTIASIIENEATTQEGRKNVSSVIYNRLNNNMPIQSDATTYYAVQVDMSERDLYQKELNSYNPYNTRGPDMQGKLPIGPISSVSRNSIEAALRPNDTDYLFFVADKNGNLYFTETVYEHNELVRKLKSKNLWFKY